MKLNYKSILAATALAIVAVPSHAGLVTDWYAGATAGIGGQSVYLDNDHHKSFSAQSYGALVGVDLPVVRFEGEYNYLNVQDLSTSIIMGNAYVKLPGLVVVNPYIGVGVGMVLGGDSDIENYKAFDTTVAYQGMLGATLNIPALPFKVDVEGRVLMAPDVYEKRDDSMAWQYDARIKLRYIF